MKRNVRWQRVNQRPSASVRRVVDVYRLTDFRGSSFYSDKKIPRRRKKSLKVVVMSLKKEFDIILESPDASFLRAAHPSIYLNRLSVRPSVLLSLSGRFIFGDEKSHFFVARCCCRSRVAFVFRPSGSSSFSTTQTAQKGFYPLPASMLEEEKSTETRDRPKVAFPRHDRFSSSRYDDKGDLYSRRPKKSNIKFVDRFFFVFGCRFHAPFSLPRSVGESRKLLFCRPLCTENFIFAAHEFFSSNR